MQEIAIYSCGRVLFLEVLRQSQLVVAKNWHHVGFPNSRHNCIQIPIHRALGQVFASWCATPLRRNLVHLLSNAHPKRFCASLVHGCGTFTETSAYCQIPKKKLSAHDGAWMLATLAQKTAEAISSSCCSPRSPSQHFPSILNQNNMNNHQMPSDCAPQFDTKLEVWNTPKFNARQDPF
jgi:hypothetical protein